MEHTFVIRNVDTSVYGLPTFINLNGDDVENIEAKTSINWRATIDIREWGINGIYSHIDSAKIEIKYDHYDVEDGIALTVTLDVIHEGCAQVTIEHNGTITVIQDDWTYKSCIEMTEERTLYPVDVTIDFEKRKITIE